MQTHVEAESYVCLIRVFAQFAQLLDQQFESEGRADPPAFFRATKVGDMMHQHGINMRHLVRGVSVCLWRVCVCV